MFIYRDNIQFENMHFLLPINPKSVEENAILGLLKAEIGKLHVFKSNICTSSHLTAVYSQIIPT